MSNVVIAGTPPTGDTALPIANSIDPVNDYSPIYTASATATQAINRNTYLGLSSAPVGLTDSQTLTNKTLTSPTINGATLSGTLSGTYTLGGTPTFPSTVVSTTGVQTLTNKTLTSPTINTPTITNATLSSDAITGYSSSSSGTIYGITVSSGVITTTTALGPNTVTNSAVAANALYTSKFYNPYKFFVYRSASLSQTSNAIIHFDTTVFDTGSNFNTTSTYQFTAPVTGFYHISMQVNFQGGSALTFAASIYKNGSEYIRGDEITGTGSVVYSLEVGSLISLTAGDTVSGFFGSSNTGGTQLNVGNTPIQTFMYGFMESAT